MMIITSPVSTQKLDKSKFAHFILRQLTRFVQIEDDETIK